VEESGEGFRVPLVSNLKQRERRWLTWRWISRRSITQLLVILSREMEDQLTSGR
jgi:hypothetical protein